MFRRRENRQPRSEPYVSVRVTYKPVTAEQIEAYQLRQQLLGYLDSVHAGSNDRYDIHGSDDLGDPFYEPMDGFDDPFNENEAHFQRIIDETERDFAQVERDFAEADRPFRDLEAELGYMGAPNLGDITVIDGKTYMVTGTSVNYGARVVRDP